MPRRAAPTSPASTASSRSTRSMRSNPLTEETTAPLQSRKSQSSQQPSSKPALSAASTKSQRTTRTTRSNGYHKQEGGAEQQGASESGTEGDQEDGDEDDDEEDDEAEDPAVDAPSGIVTRKRGHQTGLSLSLSNTTLEAFPRGTKRELSASTAFTPETRPRKTRRQIPRATKVHEDDNDDDDDDMYNAVNDISESDDDPSDIERIEAQNIIKSVERAERARSEDSWAGFTLEGIAVDDESPFFAEHFAVTEPNSEIDLEGTSNQVSGHTSPLPTSAPIRRVRFEGIDSSSSSDDLSADSDMDETTFPDLLFNQQDHILHNSTRQLFDMNDSEPQHLSDESFWDAETDTPVAVAKPKVGIKLRRDDSSAEEDFSGYETDSSSGQTTDDEAVPPLTVHRPHTVLRLNPEAPRTKATRVRRPTATARTASKSGKGPCVGTWIADPSKPIGVIHPRTKRMIYIAPRIPSLPHAGVSHAMSSAESSPTSAYVDLERQPWPTSRGEAGESDSSQREGSFDGGARGGRAADDFILDTPRNGLASSLLPLPFQATSDASFFAITASDASLGLDPAFDFGDEELDDDDDDDDEDLDEAQLDISAFIDFGDEDSDSADNIDGGEAGETNDSMPFPSTLAESSPLSISTQRLPTITPKRSRSRSSSQNLLEHFDRGVVSAFRRNQNRHQAVLRRPVAATRVGALKAVRRGVDAPLMTMGAVAARKNGGVAAGIGLGAGGVRFRDAPGAAAMAGRGSRGSMMAPFTGVNTARLRSGTL